MFSKHVVGLRGSCGRKGRSGTEEGGREDRDAIVATVCLGAGGENDRVEELIADAFSQPGEVSRVGFAHCCGELDLDGDDTAVWADDDEVDFAFTALGAQVANVGFGCLRCPSTSSDLTVGHPLPQTRSLKLILKP